MNKLELVTSSSTLLASRVDLDGLEWATWTQIEKHSGEPIRKRTYFDVKITIVNNSSLSRSQISELYKATKAQFKTSLSYLNKDTYRQYIARSINIVESNEKPDKGLVVELSDDMLLDIRDKEGNRVDYEGITTKGGKGATQNNYINVITKQGEKSIGIADIALTIIHELGHAGGLRHPWDKPLYSTFPNSDGSYDVLVKGAAADIYRINEAVKNESPLVDYVIESSGIIPETSLKFEPSEMKLKIFDNLMNTTENIYMNNIPSYFEPKFMSKGVLTEGQLQRLRNTIEPEDNY